jgi:hypothetical protein
MITNGVLPADDILISKLEVQMNKYELEELEPRIQLADSSPGGGVRVCYSYLYCYTILWQTVCYYLKVCS